MYLDHRVTGRVARVLNMIDADALLLDSNGVVILPEGDQRVFNLPEGIRQKPTEPLVYGGVTLIGTADEQPSYICLQGNSDEIRKCALLCAELINMLLKEDMSQTNREQTLRMMLRGDVEVSEFEALAAEHGIPMQGDRCVMYFYFQEYEAENAIKLMGDLLSSSDDMVVEVGRNSIAMLKNLDALEEYDQLEEYARAVENTFLTETGKPVYVGISEIHSELSGISEAFAEAKNAINVGRIYHPNRTVFTYRSLLLERFLNEISSEMSAGYNNCIFNRKTARLFNEVMVHTIETFFDNSLNLSETARKLYVHRNTLVYRLEKVQRIIGLDLRNFDDAVTFKMMMLLGKNTGNRKFRL
ncbi:MAG: helix-turn-helix domain-containing protein [Christensenellales bacterium]|nr:helix-turn-helix domain-containing protein [Christensenellales bacterium]